MSTRRRSFAPLVTISLTGMLLGCQPAGQMVVPMPTSSPSPSSSPTPSASAAPMPSTTPAAPSPTPTASSSDTPAETASLDGTVKNDGGSIVAGVTVRLTRTADSSMVAETTTNGTGYYSFASIPAGEALTVSVVSSQYNHRKLEFFSRGPVTLNFQDGAALSNKPEIIAISPKQSAEGVAPDTPIDVTFSMAVDKASVLAALAVELNSERSVTLSSGTEIPAANFPATNTSAVFTSSNYAATWVTDSHVVFKPIAPLPVTISGPTFSYRISFDYQGNLIKSTNGIDATFPQETPPSGPFYFGGQHVPYINFSVMTGFASRLKVASIRPSGNRITVDYNQPMYWNLNVGQQAGGASGNTNDAAAANNNISSVDAAANYEVQVNGGGYQAVTPANFAGARAYFDDTDPNHRKVILLADPGVVFAAPGSVVELRVKTSVRDALGNSLIVNGADNYIKSVAI